LKYSRTAKGIKGEEAACRYFEKHGYKILERRFRSAFGEVDIIIRKKDVVVFAEVKAWDILGMENLEYSVNSAKQNRIRNTALFFLRHHSELSGCRIRFDLVFLSWRTEKLVHWENAF